MQIAIAGISHETQTSLPGKTDLNGFSVSRAEEITTRDRSRPNSSLGRMIVECEKAGVEAIPLVYASGGVGPTVTDRVYDCYAGEICEELKRRAGEWDGILLSLHGAMVTESRPDPELDLIRDIRKVVGYEIPVMVSLDLHANLAPEILEEATAIFGYRCSPHIDVGETGQRAARAIIDVLADGTRPVTAMKKPGLVVPSLYSATTQPPASDIRARVLEWNSKPGVIDVSFFFGFAWSDVPQLGVSAVAVTDGAPDLAARIVEDLSDMAWSHRVSLTQGHGDLYSVEEGVSLAIEKGRTAQKPIILLDHADRMQDTTFVLRELLKQGAEDAAHPLLYDPEAVKVCEEAGIGSQVRLAVGSRSSDRAGGPVNLVGTVKWVGEKQYIATGPMSRGGPVTHGLTAIVQAEGVWLQITSRRASLIDADPIEQYGANVDDFRIIVTKSKTHFRAVYEEVGEAIIVVDAPEYSPADVSRHIYENVPPGVYPITERCCCH